MKKFRNAVIGLAVGASLLASGTAHADLKDDIVTLVGDNATSYIHPLTNSLGVAMNSGWHNSSKSYKFLLLPFGIQAYFGLPIAMINDDLRTYDFSGSIQTSNFMTPAQSSALGLTSDELRITKEDVPTIVGSEDGVALTLEDILLENGVAQSAIDLAETGGLNVNQEVFALPGGIAKAADLSFMPMTLPTLGVNVGLPFRAQVGLRMMPAVNVPDMGKISQFGMKFQYEFTQFIPVLAQLPLVHTSAHYAFNNADLFGMLELNNWQLMLNASADFSFLVGLGVYGSVGYQSSTMALNYTVPDEVVGLGGTVVKLEDEGDNAVVAQIGARITLSVFDIMADMTLGKTMAYSVGIGLGLNGL